MKLIFCSLFFFICIFNSFQVYSQDNSKVTKYDMDGDGNADILWRNMSSGKMFLWGMNGLSISLSQHLDEISLDWDIAGRGDFNDDGKSDILWRNNQSGRNYI